MFRPATVCLETDRLWVVSDLHLWDDQPAKTQAFIRLVQRATAEGVPIVCGGDFFHLFLGRRGCQTALQRYLFQVLGDLRTEGLQFYWIEGNRDFRPVFWKPVVQGVGRRMVGHVGTHRIGMVHGHGLNRRDWSDWLWQKVVHSTVVTTLAQAVPAPALLRWAVAAERRIRTFPSAYKRRIPWPYILRRVRRTVDLRGFRWWLVGHFHVFAWVPLETPDGPVEVIFVPSWDEGPTYLEFRADGTWSLHDAEGARLDPKPLVPVARESPLAGSPPWPMG
ncbi:UDP-2,3-diacylglucosamine hydrolase [bacterium HR11]|nr:UDP-2,3-diacylglucosamine hydrolase [bacterium HR11]